MVIKSLAGHNCRDFELFFHFGDLTAIDGIQNVGIENVVHTESMDDSGVFASLDYDVGGACHERGFS